jgi:hypothetical protein
MRITGLVYMLRRLYVMLLLAYLLYPLELSGCHILHCLSAKKVFITGRSFSIGSMYKDTVGVQGFHLVPRWFNVVLY